MARRTSDPPWSQTNFVGNCFRPELAISPSLGNGQRLFTSDKCDPAAVTAAKHCAARPDFLGDPGTDAGFSMKAWPWLSHIKSDAGLQEVAGFISASRCHRVWGNAPLGKSFSQDLPTLQVLDFDAKGHFSFPFRLLRKRLVIYNHLCGENFLAGDTIVEKIIVLCDLVQPKPSGKNVQSMWD